MATKPKFPGRDTEKDQNGNEVPVGPTGVAHAQDYRGNPAIPVPGVNLVTPGDATPMPVTDLDELVAQSGTSDQLRDEIDNGPKTASSIAEAGKANPWGNAGPSTFQAGLNGPTPISPDDVEGTSVEEKQARMEHDAAVRSGAIAQPVTSGQQTTGSARGRSK